MDAAKKIILALWLVVMTVAHASALTPHASENRVWENFNQTPETHRPESTQVPQTHQEKTSFGYENAVGCCLAAKGAGLVDDAAKLPVGRLGNPMSVPGPQNVRTTISGREFSGHALDQMQGRGFMPSVIENTIKQGTTFPTRAGTIGYYDAVNNVRVITDAASGRVVTVIPGAP